MPGGPQYQDYSKMTASMAAIAKKEDCAKRKAWTDAQHMNRLKKKNTASPPSKSRGHVSDTLRPLEEVKRKHLVKGNVFPSREILWMRIVKEALLRGINVKASRVDWTNLTVYGYQFYASGTFKECYGWECNEAICREGDDLNNIPDKYFVMDKIFTTKTPLALAWVIPTIMPTVEKDPGVSYEQLRSLIRPYAKDFHITDGILQEGRDLAKKAIFGTPESNVQYAEGIAFAMRKLSHEVKLLFTTRAQTLANIGTVVLKEEHDRRKKAKELFLEANDRREILNKWKEDNAIFISEALGIDGGPMENKFLTGILVAPSMSKHLVHHIQDVIQADRAHTSFRKYMLFLAYASTANRNMINLALGILFRNEDLRNRNHFWEFIVNVHPSINQPQATILMDQDKGSINAVRGCIPLAFNFHCSFHHKENIIKNCGCPSGKNPKSALFLYNLLRSCNNMISWREQRGNTCKTCTRRIVTTSQSSRITGNFLQPVVPWVTIFVCMVVLRHRESNQ